MKSGRSRREEAGRHHGLRGRGERKARAVKRGGEESRATGCVVFLGWAERASLPCWGEAQKAGQALAVRNGGA